MSPPPLRAFLVDDEPLALKRLRRLLDRTGRVEIVGEATDAETARPALRAGGVDAAFVDIQMPGTTGLELAAGLPVPPWVVFVTAHDRYALRAFEVNALDYLVKPVQQADLARAIDKIERTRGLAAPDAGAEARALVERVEAALRALRDPVERIAARVGDKYALVELARVTHFRAETKATIAVTEGGERLEVDGTLADLERRLGARFVRIHRALLVSLPHVQDLDARPQGGVWVTLKDAARTALPVARDRVRELKTRIGL